MSDSLPYAEVIGDPIDHSKSPLIHNFWLEKLGIEAEYRKAHVQPGELASYFLSRRADPDWLGCNVTLPHKVAVMEYVEAADDIRRRIGAVNTIACETGGPLIGTNTDAGGFLQPIAHRDWSGKHAVMIGSGGAARAVLYALGTLGLGGVTVMARDAGKAQALIDGMGARAEIMRMRDALPAADLLINATSLGMKGQPPLDIDLSPMRAGGTVYDIVYAPLETSLLAEARARGLDAVDGLGMLIGQAAIAFDIFFDAEAPREHDDELRAMLTT